MKVHVRVECVFEVEVESVSPEQAVRAVEANWETHYRHNAKWRAGTAPQDQHGRVVCVWVPKEERS